MNNEDLPKARDGWPLSIGQRCYRFTKDGIQLKGQVVVTGFISTKNHTVAVEVEGLTSGNQGVTLPDQLRAIDHVDGSGEKAPDKVKWYRERKRFAAKQAEIAAKKKAPKKVKRKL